MCGIICIYKTSHPDFLTWNHHFEDITPTILDMSTVSVSSHQHYRWYHSHSTYDITSSICETFCPLYLWHPTHYAWHQNPVCWLHDTRPVYDIICATEDVTSTLSHQATIFMTSHPLQAWHHNPCIWHRTTCIFVITTAPLISHPFYMTWHPLHVWYHMHYIEHHIHCLCLHPSVLRTAQTWHMKPHPVCSSKYTLSLWHHSH